MAIFVKLLGQKGLFCRHNVMSDDQIRGMIRNYNDAIRVCRSDPTGHQASENKTICGMEKLMGHSVSNRLKNKEVATDDPEVDFFSFKEPMHAMMCGCRLTAAVMFLMIVRGLTLPVGNDFIEEYQRVFGSGRSIAATILEKGLHDVQLSYIEGGRVSHISTTLPHDEGLWIVAILKHEVSGSRWVPVHTFVLRITEAGHKCQILSTWYSGGNTKPSPITMRELESSELRTLLTPSSLQVRQNTEFLFGEGNSLAGDLLLVFLGKDALLASQGVGGSRRKKRTRNKSKRRKGRRRRLSRRHRGARH